MSASPWQSYWQSHATHNSFLHEYESGDGPYGLIDHYWQSIFTSIKSNTVVVDLGAGNGALSHLYIKHVGQPQCRSWHNVDYAQIQSPTAHVCVTHTQADMHALPFADNSVDLVVSMYGIEYSDLSRSLAEVARVLQPGGQCVLLMHHPQSIITAQSRVTIAVLEVLLKEPMLAGLAATDFTDKQALQQYCFQVLKKHLHQVPTNAKEDVKLIGQNVFNILQFNAPLVDLINQLRLLGLDITAQMQRLTQQIKAAEQAAQLHAEHMHADHMLSSFKHVKLNTLDYAGLPIATTLIGNK